MIVREVLSRSASWLTGRGFESARLEAELLLAFVLKAKRIDLYAASDRRLVDGELDCYRDLLRRRASGEPVAYLTGSREFYGLDFRVTKDVLVPRPETELLVDRARELKGSTLLDLGTGTGCIAVACAVRLPEARITATDISAAALEVARSNAERHGVADRIRFLEGDLFDALPGPERFDLICANPPYVPDGQAPEVGAHEPHVAVYGGPNGTDVLTRILRGAPDHLAEAGRLLVEVGEDQAHLAGPDAVVHRDLAGLPRVIEVQANAS